MIFRHPLPLVRFQTIEWRYKNNRCTLLPWPPSSPLERTYFMDVSKRVNPKNFKKIIYFPILKETQHTIFWSIRVFTSLGSIFHDYFTWPSTDICLKGDNLRKWYESNFFYFLCTIKREEWKKMWYEKIFLILCDVSYSAS